jgi:hypothetical protein
MMKAKTIRMRPSTVAFCRRLRENQADLTEASSDYMELCHIDVTCASTKCALKADSYKYLYLLHNLCLIWERSDRANTTLLRNVAMTCLKFLHDFLSLRGKHPRKLTPRLRTPASSCHSTSGASASPP